MRLTTQMRAEVEKVHTRSNEFIERIEKLMQFSDFEGLDGTSIGGGDKIDSIINELSTYKVRLENILCETDDKEQDLIPSGSRKMEKILLKLHRRIFHIFDL